MYTHTNTAQDHTYPNTLKPNNGQAKNPSGRSHLWSFILLSPSWARLVGKYQGLVELKASSEPGRGALVSSLPALVSPCRPALRTHETGWEWHEGLQSLCVDPRERLSCNSPGQRMSPASGLSTRWSLQQGEKNLTRHFKPISRRASGEPQRAPDNPICCE